MLLINAATTSASAKIATRFAKFSYKIIVPAVTNAATALSTAAAIKVKITRRDKFGEDPQFPEGSLIDRLELNTHLNSAVVVTNNGTDTTIKGSILLSHVSSGGSITPKENETYDIDLSAIPAGVTVTVHSIEYPGDATQKHTSTYVGILPSAPTPVDVVDADLLACERSKLSQVELHYPDGKKLILLPEEVEDLMDDHKPNAYIKNGLVTAGGERSYFVDTEGAIRAIVTYNAAGNCELLKRKGV